MNNNKMDLREMEWDGMDWTDLAQEPSGSILNSCITGGFLRRAQPQGVRYTPVTAGFQ
jgi:hypothetical protein